MNQQDRIKIDRAMRFRSKLLVNYESRFGVHVDVIIPISWSNTGELYVNVVERDRHIYIHPGTIHKCEIYDESSATQGESLAMMPPTPVENSIPSESGELVNPANIPTSTPRLNRKTPPVLVKGSKNELGIEDVKNDDEWRRLMLYYLDCLTHEYRQKFDININKTPVCFFDSQQSVICSFLEGNTTFIFEEDKHKGIYKYVAPSAKRKKQQLYLGYPIFVSGTNKIAPILIAPINYKESTRKIELYVEDYEISYAALASLKLTDEEIYSVFDSLASISPDKGQSVTQSLIENMFREIGNLLGEDLKRLISNDGSLKPSSFVNRPCFFWAEPDNLTSSLLKELKSLSDCWGTTPNPLKYLVSKTPEYSYPAPPIESQDRNVYIAPVYENQRKAISAAMSEPITVVTGPPGTGKSQFILNLIVQAVLRGEKVLFASRNNKAVDVVMNRLQTEANFQGSIRTGNKENRSRAVEHISKQLKELTTPNQRPEDISARHEQYAQIHQRYMQKLSVLKKVRSQTSLKASRISEVEDIKKLLPDDLWSKVEKVNISFNDDEFNYMQVQLSSLRLEALQLKSSLDTLNVDLYTEVSEGSDETPLILQLKSFEDQWGAFGDDLLHPDSLVSIQQIQSFLGLWEVFLEALFQQNTLNSVLEEYRKQNGELEELESVFEQKDRADVRAIAEKVPPENILAFKDISRIYLSEAKKLLSKKNNFIFRVGVWLGLDRSVNELSDHLRQLQGSLDIQSTLPHRPKISDLDQIFKSSKFLAKVIEIAGTLHQSTQTKTKIDDERRNLESITIKLPGLISGNLKKINPSLGIITTTKEGIGRFVAQNTNLTENTQRIRNKIQAKIDGNANELELLRSLAVEDPDRHFGLWVANSDLTEPSLLVEFLSNWRMTLSFWKAQDSIHILSDELGKIPKEEVLANESRELGKDLFGLGAKILALQWEKYAREQDRAVFEQAESYASAVRQLLEERFTPEYSQLKSIEERCFPSVMKLFPVWATTNLSAKSNFPFSPQTFDLVIIDEASQSDLPSALPLLYRGGRIVIVGDSMQLRHVATIFPRSESATSLKYGVSPSKYSYSQFSLFDIANRSVQPNPSSILLNEHYRSDPQIFGFSKEEFYSEEMKIYTDIFRFSLPSDYMRDGTGVFWIDTPGRAQHPSGGSAYNDAELRVVSELTQKLLTDLKRRKLNHLNLGIISPYHEQEKRIGRWLDSSSMEFKDRITAGTAHTFQGDERDIIIFSPVLSNDLKERSLGWLEKTSNLLNVAVSRARITMIVVGDWKYCLSLDPRSKYRKLAEYVDRHPGRVVTSVDALPLFKGMQINIIGVLLDRHNRERNRLTLQKLLLSSEQYVYWADPFITSHVFDLILDIAKHPEFKLKDIRILTSYEQTEIERFAVNPLELKNIQNEIEKRGVNIHLGLLPKRDMPHDRHFYSVGYAINMPPFSGAYGDHKMVSEYTESKTKIDFFNTYWARAKIY